jgi:predicted O-linked N-acetylglucosamine transferase (SPINDLY family)
MDTQATYRQALQLHQQGELAQAEALYKSLIAADPKHADATHYLGVIYHQIGRHSEAVQTITQAIQLNPTNADYLSNQGLAYKALGQFDAAIECFQRALKLAPNDLDVYYNLGNTGIEAERFDLAAQAYRRILRDYPQDADLKEALCHALDRQGYLHQQSGRYAEAERCYQEAIQFQPQQPALYYNLGNALRELGKAKEAAQQYQRAIQLNPNDADAYNNLGNVQRELGDLQAAINAYETALKLNPELYHAKVHLVHQKQHACDWQGLDDAINQIKSWVHTKPEAQISPFAFLAMPNTSANEQKQCANNWLKNRYSSAFAQGKALAFEYPRTHQKLRLGYLSADFRLHPLASLISELIELHDRNAFEIYAYSYGVNDQSAERKRLEKAFDHFVDIRALSTLDAAKKINDDQIDILVDLTGFTQTSRSQIVALRPAPINLSWLGFPGTMGELNGTPLFDYLLTDAVITPPASAKNYAEKLALLPHTYQPNDRKRPIEKTKNRQAYDLPENAFVFCCFNQTFKILPKVFDAWMHILKHVPNSVLWLLECNSLAKSNLIREAEVRGISQARLIFAPRVSMDEHMARQACADLFLDTLPYNAHTTTSDALWAGLPVLTCMGDTFASRVAASLLNAADLPELITQSLAEYQAKAIELASQPETLKAIKHKLDKHREQVPLFDTVQFARDLEKIYTGIWQNYSA